ncbi:hypothetical protein MFLAVUS_002986 [Mucor flavus]|uniref:G-protein coupled receptors family 3 profile domain-containing protein n=1 Tax=Mucor flavus TaxID=439312 RepID=A0ABP9YRV5_9FUNG
MTQQSVIGDLPFNSLAFGRLLVDDLYSNINQTDNSTVYITPRYNTTGKTELKIGVLLPFTQKNDNLTAQIVWGGSSAIRMAVNDINSRQVIPGAYITLIEKDSFPDSSLDQMSVTNAVYASVTLLQQGVIGVIGDISSSWTSLSALMTSTLEIPQCSFTANAIAFSDKTQYKYFFRTIPTQVIIADVMLSFASKQGWNKLGVLYTDDPLGQQFYQRALIQAGTMDLHILQYQSIASTQTTDDMINALKNITNGGARIIMVAATAQPQISILMQAQKMGLINKDYVWLMMGDTSSELEQTVIETNQNYSLHVDYASAYQGLFFFDNWLSLHGYQPFETFLDQWATLNPEAYPYAGYRNISSYEGLAYSCMMIMAEGFGKVINNSKNKTDELIKLATGQLGDEMLPSAFNIGYVGPEGPMNYDSNGDLTTGNYQVYNLQYGSRQIIGKSTGGFLNITSSSMFFDGTHVPPLDSPPSIPLNPDITSPISHAILALSSAGILFSIVCFFIVLFNRKHEVFKASSPLFCCLELVGFVLTYISVMMMIGIPTETSCIVTPVTFSLGFLLVLGNMIAKNYRIYRIFNNIFITKNVITDNHLLQTVAGLIGLEMIILTVGLLVAKPVPTKFEVSFSTHYWSCEPQGSNKIVFLVLSTVYAAFLLLFATFLAYKTRFAGRQYNRNILFSALVGFAVVVNPLADFYTKYYIDVISILWATTFSLLILFLPKLQAFYRVKMKEKRDEQQQQEKSNNTTSRPSVFSFLKSSHNQTYFDHHTSHSNSPGISELLSLEQILASDEPVLDDDDDNSLRRRKPSAVSTTLENIDGGSSNFIEVHEGEMPIRKVFRYFPFLSQWEMHYVMVFPWLGYFSHFSKCAKKGTVMSYHHASVYSAKLEDYVLKVHGQGWCDMYIQLPNLNALNTWEQCFNQKKPDYLDFRRKPIEESMQQEVLQSLDMSLHHPHDTNIMLESSMSHDHLLRRMSDKSDEVTAVHTT